MFNLTTSHMSTYMVVGTLFLGYSVSHMWYITTFPEDPPWLKFFWMNCFISAMCYGFLAPRTSDLGYSVRAAVFGYRCRLGCWPFWSYLRTDMIVHIKQRIYIYIMYIIHDKYILSNPLVAPTQL